MSGARALARCSASKIAKMKSFISIITATYNRAHLLSRVFESLVKGTIYPLEWIIIDDGSIDETRAVVSKVAAESPFPVIYRKKENGGVHTAVNVAFGLVQGELFVKLDSDDWLCPTAIEDIQKDWDNISYAERSSFAGLCYLCAYEDGRVVGSSFPEDVIDGTHTEIRINKRIFGDKCEAIRADLVHRNTYREFPGEYSIPYDAPLFPRFSKRGLLFRHINRVAKIVEYQADGITMSVEGKDRRAMSPRGFAEIDKEMLTDRDLNVKTKCRLLLKSILSKSRKSVGVRIYMVSVLYILIDIILCLGTGAAWRDRT
jgi:glycosyltransferase involved in cell wall biosynthesis